MEQPMLITENENAICLIPEFSMMTGVQESVRTSPARYYLMREVIGSTQPDMQRRLLDIKKYFFDILASIGQNDASVLADINISSIPYIFDGQRLPQGNI